MKKYALLKLFQSGNLVLKETTQGDMEDAVAYFQHVFNISGQTLNDNGYLKIGEITYTVAECYSN